MGRIVLPSPSIARLDYRNPDLRGLVAWADPIGHPQFYDHVSRKYFIDAYNGDSFVPGSSKDGRFGRKRGGAYRNELAIPSIAFPQVTIIAFVKPKILPSVSAGISQICVLQNAGSGWTNGFLQMGGAGNTDVFTFGLLSGTVPGTVPVVVDQFYTVALTNTTSGVQRMTVNGVQDATGTSTSGDGWAMTNFKLGDEPAVANAMECYGVMLFNRILSDDDIARISENRRGLLERPRRLFAVPAPADSGVGSASGTSTVSGVGASTAASAASASGTSTASATGAATAASTASASGTSTAAATGASIAAAVGAAAGTSTAEAVGAEGGSIASGVGSAAGSSTASGIGAATAAGTGSASGASTASATGASTSAATGSAAGVATASGISPTYAAGVGEAAGTSAVDGRSPSTVAGVGSASGSSTVTGIAQDQATTFGGVPFFQSEHANKYRRKKREEIEEAAERADVIAIEVEPEAKVRRPVFEAVENAIARIALQIDVSAPKIKATRALKTELKRQQIPYEVLYAQQLEEQRNALLVQELQTLIQKDLDDQDEEEAMLLLM